MRWLFALVLCSAIPAHADPPHAGDVHAMHTDDCARARAAHRTCVLDMGAEHVRGNAPVATGTRIEAIRTARNPSLVRVRRDFIVEILRSAEDL